MHHGQSLFFTLYYTEIDARTHLSLSLSLPPPYCYFTCSSSGCNKVLFYCLSADKLRALILPISDNITLCNAEPNSVECALGSKLHTILYAREGHFSRHSGSVWNNSSKSKNIWGGDFYRTWTAKLMNCACASAVRVSFTVQVR